MNSLKEPFLKKRMVLLLILQKSMAFFGGSIHLFVFSRVFTKKQKTKPPTWSYCEYPKSRYLHHPWGTHAAPLGMVTLTYRFFRVILNAPLSWFFRATHPQSNDFLLRLGNLEKSEHVGHKKNRFTLPKKNGEIINNLWNHHLDQLRNIVQSNGQPAPKKVVRRCKFWQFSVMEGGSIWPATSYCLAETWYLCVHSTFFEYPLSLKVGV